MDMKRVEEIKSKLECEYASLPSNNKEYNAIYADLSDALKTVEQQDEQIERYEEALKCND